MRTSFITGGGRQGDRSAPLSAATRAAVVLRPALAPATSRFLLIVAILGSACQADKLVSPRPPGPGGGGPPTPQPPVSPSALGQQRSDGSTAIPQGSAVPETSVQLAANVSDPDSNDTVRLEIELRAVSVAFADAPTHSSGAGPSGTRRSITVTGLTDGTEYHWQARAVDAGGRASGWVSFGTNAEQDRDFQVAMPPPPPAASDPAASAPAQYRNDGSTALGVGATTDEDAVVLAATVTDPDAGASIRLQVEVRPAGSAFTGSPTDESGAVASGNRATVAVGGLADDTDYHWQYRAIDETGRTGPWTGFGGNGGSAADFRVAVPETPAAPAAMGQFRADGTTPIPVGGGTGGLSAVLAATVSDPDPGDELSLEIEVRDTGAALGGTPTHTIAGLASGDRTSVTVTVVVLIGYHWQARTCDRTRCSAWARFGGNANGDADFVGSLISGAARER